MIEPNKITLMGDRIGYGKLGKTAAFLISPDMCTCVAATLFHTVAMTLCYPEAPPLDVMASSAQMFPWLAIAGAGSRALTRLRWAMCGISPKMMAKKVVNLAPEPQSPPTAQMWLTGFADAQTISKMIVPLCFIAPTVMVGVLLAKNALTARAGIEAVACMAPFVMHYTRNVHRAGKILNFEWVVEDKGPPPQRVPVREKVKTFVRTLVPVAAPSGSRA